jgi:outer membrane protein assembly factor BamB
MRHTRLVLLSILLAFLVAMPVVAEDWTRFRGANGDGRSSSKNLPTEFGPDTNRLWETDVPFGRSSPIIAGDRIYLTATED